MPAANRLRELIDNPESTQLTGAGQFALNQGLNAATRTNSRVRGSGGLMAELTRLGTGFALQDRGAEMDRLSGIVRDENQFSLGSEQNRIASTRNANDFTLGSEQNANTLRRNNQDYGLGLYRAGNDFTLGSQSNRNTARRNWMDFQLGSDRNGMDAESRRRRDAMDFWDRFSSSGG